MNLRADNLLKKYKQRTVVNDVSFNVSQGEIVGLLGPNGAGKTTSFYMIVGLIKPNEGKIFLDNKDITTDPMYRRAKKGIGYLAQEASVFRKLTVEDNIKAVLEMGDMSRERQKEKLEELIDEFSLHKVRRNRGDLLSGAVPRSREH
jgi:lipopolysaccharide export system ATP-binding protein